MRMYGGARFGNTWMMGEARGRHEVRQEKTKMFTKRSEPI